MDNRVRLLPNTYQKLTDNMGFPRQLGGICNVLPLATAICEQWIERLNAFWRWPHNFQQSRARVSPSLFYNLNAYPFARNASWHKQDTTLVSAYGIPSIGKIC
jgi:hypothetical protein